MLQENRFFSAFSPVCWQIRNSILSDGVKIRVQIAGARVTFIYGPINFLFIIIAIFIYLSLLLLFIAFGVCPAQSLAMKHQQQQQQQ